MGNLKHVLKVTPTQYDTLASGGVVGGYAGLDPDNLYLVQDNTQYVPYTKAVTLSTSQQTTARNNIGAASAEAYLKSAVVNGNTLTLTDQDNTAISFTSAGGIPEITDTTLDIANIEPGIYKVTQSTVSVVYSTNQTVSITGSGKILTVTQQLDGPTGKNWELRTMVYPTDTICYYGTIMAGSGWYKRAAGYIDVAPGSSVRPATLTAGVYKINTSPYLDIYYNGSTSTNSIRVASGGNIDCYLIVSTVSTYHTWYFFAPSSAIVYLGSTTSTSGTYSQLVSASLNGTFLTLN